MAVSVRASRNGLLEVDRARKAKGWRKSEPAWSDFANTSTATLKRFWQGRAIAAETFAAICEQVGIEDWQAIADFVGEAASEPERSLPVGSADWVERTGLVEELLPRLESPRRVVVLAGITGIGKTVLAEQLVLALADRQTSDRGSLPFRRVSFDDGGIGTDFYSGGAALLRGLGERPSVEDQKDSARLVQHILQVLRAKPVRLQVDSLERLLAGSEDEGGSEFGDAWWLELFGQYLAGDEGSSQLIVTTQEVPGGLQTLGSRHKRRWFCENVPGLSEEEQLALFGMRGLSLAGEAAGYFRRIGELYAGHPLVLEVIAEDLKACGGDVVRYWRQCRFEELEAKRPVRFTRRQLRLELQKRVKQSLESLPEEAVQLLCRASVYRYPVPRSFWLAMLPEVGEERGEMLLSLLEARGLAEENWEPEAWLGADREVPLQQHNLIRVVAYELLKGNREVWQAAERQAARMWLTAYEPAEGVANLEKVRGYLEAFYHYCDIEDWDTASELFMRDLNLPKNSRLHWLLFGWGYYQEQLKLCQRLCDRATPEVKVVCHLGIGIAHNFLADYPQAIAAHQESLRIAREIGDRRGEGIALGNLGIAYNNLGEYRQAIDYLQQCLAILGEIGDRRGEGNALGNLGLAYNNLGEYRQALDYYQQWLAIAREIGDRRGEGNALGNLGNAYNALGEYRQALDYCQQWLAIAREIGDRRGEGNALGNLGIAYNELGEYRQALDYYQQWLAIAREIGDLAGEGRALGNLGVAYNALGEYRQALDYHQQHLAIAKEIGDRRGEGAALGNLGVTYIKLARYDEALENLQTCLAIFQEIQSRAGEAEALKELAKLHQETGESALALEYCEQARAMAVELGIPLAQECEELRQQLQDAG